MLQPHRVITAGAAALCLFSTGCDTDGFNHRDAQGPQWKGGGWRPCQCPGAGGWKADATENGLDGTARSLNKDVLMAAEWIMEGKKKIKPRTVTSSAAKQPHSCRLVVFRFLPLSFLVV